MTMANSKLKRTDDTEYEDFVDDLRSEEVLASGA